MRKLIHGRASAAAVMIIVAVFLVCQVESMDRNSAGSLCKDGRSLFYRQIRKELRLHPRAFSLINSDIVRIMDAESGIPDLYDAVLRILYREQAVRQLALPGGKNASEPRFKAVWLDLCREGASRFVDSLFIREQLPESLGMDRTVLDCVLASLGIASEDNLVKAETASGPTGKEKDLAAFPPEDPILRFVEIRDAHKLSRGKGVKIEVIGADPGGISGSRAAPQSAPWELEPSPVRTDILFSPAATAAQAVAPEADVRFRSIRSEGDSPYRYWTAFETALAVREAAREGVLIVVVTNVFSLDYPFLRDACTEATGKNVVIVCPIGPGTGEAPEIPQSFPAHYTNTLAVAGAAWGRGNMLAPISASVTHFTDLTAPVPLSSMQPGSAAAAGLCAGAAAMIVSLMQPGEEELSGQYFQRIREILVRSADPDSLGGSFFDPATGYGLLNAAVAVGKELEEYKKRRIQIEENLKKRLKAMADAQKEAEKASEKDEAVKKRDKNEN